MLIKLNRQDTITKYPNFPSREYNPEVEEFDSFYPRTYSSYVLTLPSKSFKRHAKLLGIEIKDLAAHLGVNHLIFLGDLDIPWLCQNHDFKQAKEGLQYLSNEKVGRKFNGSLQVDMMDLPIFIKHLAWLVRTNAVLPYVYFIDPKQNLIGTICQYGNLHISAVSKKVDKHLKDAIAETLFEYLTENCLNKFSKNGSIKDRQITI